MTKPVTLAAIAGAHGVAGEVRLKLFGEGVAGLSCHKSFNDGALTLLKIRDDGKGGAVARLAESTSRADAEKLTRRAESLEAAERLGFHYSGLCPLFDDGHDVLRLQYVNVPIDFSALAVAGPFAREIVDYVQADRARVDAL
jgi:hypothetical protein